jgi:hypothetical protein
MLSKRTSNPKPIKDFRWRRRQSRNILASVPGEHALPEIGKRVNWDLWQQFGFFIRLSLRDGISHYESGTNSASAAMLSDEK